MPSKYKALPTLGFTHFQAAQLVTVGKRATLWMNDLLMDLEEVEYRIATLKLLRLQGDHRHRRRAFLELFEGDHEKVKELERKIAREDGLSSCCARDRADLFPEDGLASCVNTLVRHRPVAPASLPHDMRLLCAPERGGGAL